MKLVFALPLAFLVMFTKTGYAAQTVDLDSRGETQRILFIKTDTPKANVVLFAGGTGRIFIRKNGAIKRENNLLVRTRDLFAERGFNVAVFDAPSDRRSKKGMFGFRQTPEHAEDIKAVMDFLKSKADVPVWLVGTSRGSISAVNGAVRLGGAADGGPEGIVLVSSVTRRSKRGRITVYEADAEDISVPTLIVHNRDDGCMVTPFAGAEDLLERLSKAPVKELIAFEGGGDGGSNPCTSQTYHGFMGLDEAVVEAVTNWIEKN